ncbi:MAG: prolipoprotein diacylglyceryl transferase [Gemmatimonadetes bacterium]|nr:prolipoprotein diacylglyceryl transferase [Gemmatimonadota bacterium]
MPFYPLLSVTVHRFEVQIGSLPPLTGFGLAMLMAFLIGQIVGTAELTRRGHTVEAEAFGDFTVAAVVGGLLGAKLYYSILFHETLFSRGGFVFWGGLVGGILGTFAVIKWKKLTFTRVSDATAIGLAAAYAVGRSGCWAVGDDYGRPWNGFLAVKFPEGAPPSTVANLTQQFGVKALEGQPLSDVVAVYPTQLFEVAMGLVMFAVLWRFRAHKHAAGWLFGMYCVLAGLERFTVEFFRAKDDHFFGPLTMAQVIALLFATGGLVWMAVRRAPAAQQA